MIQMNPYVRVVVDPLSHSSGQVYSVFITDRNGRSFTIGDKITYRCGGGARVGAVVQDIQFTKGTWKLKVTRRSTRQMFHIGNIITITDFSHVEREPTPVEVTVI